MSRLRHLDCARGLAVLVMIQTHALDSWTAPAVREQSVYRALIVIGGFAAPLFLFLAGTALTLAADRRAAAGQPPRLRQLMARGLQIFGLAFLFRLQALIVSPGGDLIDLLRVDILNVMGLSMAAAAVFWSAGRGRVGRAALFSAACLAVMLSTPAIRSSAAVDRLPALVQWYLRPSGDQTVFTLFPWAGFVFAGAAWGTWMFQERADSSGWLSAASGRHRATAAAGLALMLFGLFGPPLPGPFAVSGLEGSSPAFFLLRLGGLCLVLAVLYGVTPVQQGSRRLFDVLGYLGRGSLLVYWVHMELVYGYASWVIHRSLSIPAALSAALALGALMCGVLRLRDQLAKVRNRRPNRVQVAL